MRHATGGDLDKVKRVVKLVGFVCCTGKSICLNVNVSDHSNSNDIL